MTFKLKNSSKKLRRKKGGKRFGEIRKRQTNISEETDTVRGLEKVSILERYRKNQEPKRPQKKTAIWAEHQKERRTLLRILTSR